MAIQYICSHCGKRLTIADELEGRITSCPNCGGVDIATPAPPSSNTVPIILSVAAVLVGIVVLVVGTIVYQQTQRVAAPATAKSKGPQFLLELDSFYYHSPGCADLKDPMSYPEDQILAQGYRPCPKCQLMVKPARRRPSAEMTSAAVPGDETGASVKYLGKHVGSAIVSGKGISVYDGDGFRFGVYMAELPADARSIPFSKIAGVRGEAGDEISVPGFGELRMVKSPELIVR